MSTARLLLLMGACVWFGAICLALALARAASLSDHHRPD